ncbi:MAG TPA: TolC family protein [Polyangia bacterium]|nr:TolC family protein [Polyangia bacterium]
MRVLCLLALWPGLSLGEPLTRGEAVNRALARNPELAAARARIGASEAEVVGAARLLRANPTVEGEYGDDRAFGDHGEYRAGVALSQELELGGQRGLRRAAAGARLDEARARVRAFELGVARDAADAWLALWRAERMRALAAQTVELDAGLARIAEARFAAGDISEVERNVVALDVARAQADAQAAEGEHRRAQAQLARIIASDAGDALEGAGDALEAAGEPPAPIAVEAPAKFVGAGVRAAERAHEAARGELRLQRRELVPSPTVTFGWQREQLFVESTAPPPLRLAHQADVLVGRLSLPLPIWDRRQAEVRAAQAAVDETRAERSAAELSQRADVAMARASLDGARKSAELYRAALPRAERNLELLGRAYQAGQISLAELIAAKDRALAVRRETVETQVAYARAYHELMRATGRLPTEQP